MIKIRKISQSDVVEYLAILWIIISSGFFVLNYVYNLPCMLVLLLIAIYYVVQNKSITKCNGYRLIGLLAFVFMDELISLAMYKYPLETNTLIILIIRLFSLAIIMDNISVESYIKKYTSILFVICVVSLLCFAVINFTSITLPFARNYQDGFYGTFYFRINEYTRSITTRNSGPYGEPGIFAVYIVFALGFQLFSTPVEEITKGWNAIKIIVLSVTLLTTLSGTGLICYLILFVSYVLLNHEEVNVLKNPLMFLIVFAMIIGLYYAETTYGILGEKVINQGGSYGVRLNDTLKGYQIAVQHFLTGTGIANDYSSAWTGALLANSRSNGMANFSASVGIPFLIFYLFCVFKRSLEYMNKNLAAAIVFFLVVLVSFNTQPIVLQTIGLSFLFIWKKEKLND